MKKMNEVEILIVEDNPEDAEIAVRAFKKNKLTNKLYVVNDGEQALDFIFAKNDFADRNKLAKPKIILLDLKLPNVVGRGVFI
jgi:two-component system response regulator